MTNKKEHKILRKTLSLALTMLVSILGLPLAKPQQVSATETSDPKYLSSITMDATASSSWDSKYSTSVYDDIINNYDNYTSSSPLEIDSAEKLAAFAGAVNVGKRNFNGKYVKLTNDIDLGGTDPTIEKTTSGDKFSLNITGTASNVWVPIGNYSVNFRGTFDGDGHEVSNMTVLMKQTDSTAHAGLFGYVLRGSIKNTGVKGNVYASSSSLSSSIVYAGGLVGYISVVSSISTSYATCNVYASSSSAIVYASGLAGVSYSNISNSYATGNAYAYSSASDYGSYAGGLVSFAGSSSHSISNSYATGNVYASASSGVCAGGLVGYDYSSISNSYATGNVYASASSGVCAGGLVGQSASDDSISNSYYYFKATIDAGTTGTKTSYGTGLTLEQITGNRKGRAKDNMTGFSEDNWEFPGDNGLIKYLPRVKGITYNETTNPAPRLVGIISSDFDFKAPANLTYDGSAKEATVTSKISEIPNDKITIKYYSSTGTNLTSAPIEAGTYIVKIDVAACDKYEAQTDITADHWTFTIAKADPTINSIATTATYAPSLTLKDVPYPSTTGNTPGSWSWTYPSSSIVAGTYTYSAKYTPTDTTNYNSVAKSITVTVNKADPTIGSTSTTAAYKSGLILGNVTPPLVGSSSTAGSWTWLKSTAPISSAGAHYFEAIFKPTNSNYNEVTKCILVNVSKATLQASDFNFAAPSNLEYSADYKTATITRKSGIKGIGELTVKYFTKVNGELTPLEGSSAPVNVGTYYVGINVGDDINYNSASGLTSDSWNFTITPAGKHTYRLSNDSRVYLVTK